MATTPSYTSKRQAYAAIALAALTFIACATLMVAVLVTPAPLAVDPLAVVVCIGCPMVMAWPLPSSIHALRAASTVPPLEGEQALTALRRQLARLPEREHPLGL